MGIPKLLIFFVMWDKVSDSIKIPFLFQVKWFQQQVAKKRVKRDNQRVKFNDPKWPRMWYLVRKLLCLQSSYIV